MKRRLDAKKLILRLKEMGWSSFTIDDMKASGIEVNNGIMIAAQASGLVRKGEYNKRTKLRKWIINI